jgi:hypothetical protein
MYDRERGVCRMVPGERPEVWIWYLHERRAQARARFDRTTAASPAG